MFFEYFSSDRLLVVAGVGVVDSDKDTWTTPPEQMTGEDDHDHPTWDDPWDPCAAGCEVGRVFIGDVVQLCFEMKETEAGNM